MEQGFWLRHADVMRRELGELAGMTVGRVEVVASPGDAEAAVGVIVELSDGARTLRASLASVDDEGRSAGLMRARVERA